MQLGYIYGVGVLHILFHPLIAQDGSWAVKVLGGLEAANDIAERNGFINHGQIGYLENVYHFTLIDSISTRTRDENGAISAAVSLGASIQVEFAEQQIPRKYVKRGYSVPTDVLWQFQWPWLNTGQTQVSDAGRDVNVEPVWLQGITGCNSYVAIVDDGVDYYHTDISSNYVSSLSWDYVDGDSDPYPGLEAHGTKCSGVVAMVKDNNICGVGVAFNAGIAGIRLLGSSSTIDMQEAQALSHSYAYVQVYSNSWGPDDDGATVMGPGSVTSLTLEQGTKKGRGGKGSIFIWASGNGGTYADCCAADGYVTNLYTIAIGSASSAGTAVYYDEKCSAKMAVVFVYTTSGSVQVSTATIGEKCTQTFSGTSAACPLAAGVIALVLEANANLTWRDVKYLVAYTSNINRLTQGPGEWFLNGGGLYFSHQFGFGALDAEALVNRARNWTTVPDQTWDTMVPVDAGDVVIAGGTAQSITLAYQGTGVVYVEQVVATLTLKPQGLSSGSGRGDVYITLQSPSATTSTLLFKRPYDNDRTSGYTNWPFLSVHFWGEDPRGTWTLAVHYDGSSGQVILSGLSVTVYGTASIPVAVGQAPPAVCGRGLYRNASTLECTRSCDFAVRNGYCYDATRPVVKCVRSPIPSSGTSLVLQVGSVIAAVLLPVCIWSLSM
eukprot:Em0020g486a